jgi:hypothetical protein
MNPTSDGVPVRRSLSTPSDPPTAGPHLEDPYERLAAQSPEERIGAVLGTGSHSSLPQVNQATLTKYARYLSSRLTFPFEARYSSETEPVVYPVTVTELVDAEKSAEDHFTGVLCTAHLKNKTATLPLVDIEVAEGSPNFQILEDYWYWLWNWRELRLKAARPRQPR